MEQQVNISLVKHILSLLKFHLAICFHSHKEWRIVVFHFKLLIKQYHHCFTENLFVVLNLIGQILQEHSEPMQPKISNIMERIWIQLR